MNTPESIHPGSFSGLHVLLTRPAAQSEGISAAISARGASVLSLPLLEIEPISERAGVEKLKALILNLDHYDIAIFISTNAAALGLEWIENYWPQLPAGLEAYAVGPGTAAILRSLPWPVHCSAQGVTSEDLLALPGMQDVRNRRVALFRGEGGRELIADALRARGARVDYLEIYRRRVPEYPGRETLQRMKDARVNVIVTTSMQILESFLALFDAAGEAKLKAGVPDWLQRACVIVPSQRVAERALAAGFVRVIDAGGADEQSLLAALEQCQPECGNEAERA